MGIRQNKQVVNDPTGATRMYDRIRRFRQMVKEHGREVEGTFHDLSVTDGQRSVPVMGDCRSRDAETRDRETKSRDAETRDRETLGGGTTGRVKFKKIIAGVNLMCDAIQRSNTSSETHGHDGGDQ